MKFLSMLAIVLTLGFTMVSHDAEAKRLGSGRSSGMQRHMDAPSKPMQGPIANNAAKPSPAAAPQAQSKRSWLGPIAGLAAGLGLAALASHFGFGEQMASFMMMMLIGVVIMMVVGYFLRKRAAAQQPAMAGYSGGNAYQQARQAPNAAYDQSANQFAGANTSGVAASIPPGFDTQGFIRSAKVHFIRLQAANDAANLEDIREFTTPEMFAEIKMDIADRKGASQTTDVLNIEAELLDVQQEAHRQVASVRFTGLIREEKEANAEAIDEIWHLVRPLNGGTGWLLAGIQQSQ